MHPRTLIPAMLLLGAVACAPKPPETGATPAVLPPDTVYVDRTVTRVDTVVDPETRTRLSQMEADLLASEARMQVLEEQLEEAQREVVRTMARSQTVASRAEAASGIAEAELAIRTLRSTARTAAPEADQAERYLQQSSDEFKKDNFGGALYLASQARTMAAQGSDRVRRAQAEDLRPGETPFVAPLRLRTTTRANVREGPSTQFRVLFTMEADSPVVGTSYVEGWVRVMDADGRAGWIARSLVDLRD